MKIYVLSPESIERTKRKVIIRGVVWHGFCLAIAFTTIVATSSKSDLMSEWGDDIIVIIIMVSALVIGSTLGIKKLENDLKSYQLLVSADSVVKRQRRAPYSASIFSIIYSYLDIVETKIDRKQITRVEEKPGTGLFIRTADKKRFINVPEGLEGMDELKETLSAWQAKNVNRY